LRLGSRAKGYELVDGKPEALNVSVLSCFIAGNIFSLLREYVDTHKIGWVFPAETACQCFPHYPDRVRKPDVAFVAIDRLHADRARADGFLQVVPDLVVEVISPRDTAYRVNEKIKEWLDAGTPLLWVVYPRELEVRVLYGHSGEKTFREADTLTGDPVLPGFSVPVKDLFELPA
jgi:Uma2 family endonuclease